MIGALCTRPTRHAWHLSQTLLIQAAPPLSAQAPIYDFKSSARVGYRDVRVPDSRVVIIEGIYALSSRIRRALPPFGEPSGRGLIPCYTLQRAPSLRMQQHCSHHAGLAGMLCSTGRHPLHGHSAVSSFTLPTIRHASKRGCCGGRPLLDLRVSVTGGVHFDLVKRVLRDISRSGQAPEEIIQQARHLALQHALPPAY